MSAQPQEAPSTDCQTCGRSAKECNDHAAKGWDGCCLTCDEQGRVNAHRLSVVILCTADDAACTCGAPKNMPSGMHHDYCPVNPASSRPRSDGAR